MNTLINSKRAELSNSANTNETVTVKPSKRQMPVLWAVIGKARRKFDNQFSKSNELKWKILDSNVSANEDDREKFFLAYFEQVNRLLDSIRYNNKAKEWGVDPAILATHIVFLGSATVNKVLKKGLEDTIREGEAKNLYNERFIPDNYLEANLAPKSEGTDKNA
jgi:hypothetical protein